MTSHFSEQAKKAMHGKITQAWTLSKKWMDKLPDPENEAECEAMSNEFGQLCLAYESDQFMVDLAVAMVTELFRFVDQKGVVQ